MQIQNATALKPPVNVSAVALAKSPAGKQQSKPILSAVKKEKYLHLGLADLTQSLQRKKNRRAVLEAKIKVLNEKIEAREKRLKELSNHKQ